MTQIVLDASACGKLNNLTDTVEICDPAGRVLGKFVPAMDVSEWQPISPDICEEELDQRAKSNQKRYTTAQVLAHLEKL